MLNFINGWQNPVFKIYNASTNALIETINLPLVNSEGLIESIEELKLVHELLSYDFEEQIYGYRISWTLPYKEYANKDTMLKIQSILRYRKGGYRINLIPRADLLIRNFDVIYTGDELEMGILRGGSFAIGNWAVQIVFTTKYLIDDLRWIDPAEIQYATWYEHNHFSVLV